jgi:hypothetical protein
MMMVVAVTTVGGGVATVAMTVPHPTPCRRLVRTDSVCWQSDTNCKYLCLYSKVLCRWILTGGVLSVVPFAENDFCWKKNTTSSAPKNGQIYYKKTWQRKCETNINQKPRTSGTKPTKIYKNRCSITNLFLNSNSSVPQKNYNRSVPRAPECWDSLL